MKIGNNIKYILFFLLFISSTPAFSQGQDKTVLFTARVISATNSEFLPLAYAFNPQAGNGSLSDNFGIIEMYVFPGDSIVFSYIGHKKKYYIIPRDTEINHRAIIAMEEESKMLSEVKVYRHSSEEEFKKAFLEMHLTDEKQRNIAEKNLEKSKLNVFAMQAGMGAASNFRTFSDQMTYSMANRTFVNSPLFTFTNPFAWMSFIKSIKNGDLKRKDYKKAYEFLPKENITRQKFLRDNN
jgi:hypothetical protein